MKTILIISVILTALFTWWYEKPVYVQQNPCTIQDLVDDPELIETAVKKMGPKYQYRVHPDGTLKVKLDEEWLVLKY